MKGYIYKFENIENKKIYIGQTRQKIKSRYSQHFRDAKKSTKNSAFHSALIKYGKEGFKFDVIEEIDCSNKKDLVKELNKLEIQHIKDYNCLVPNGYNIRLGGQGYYEIQKSEEVIKHYPEWGYVYYLKCSDDRSDIFFINGELSIEEANKVAIDTIANKDRYPNKVYLVLETKVDFSGIESEIKIDKLIWTKYDEDIAFLKKEIQRLSIENEKLRNQDNSKTYLM